MAERIPCSVPFCRRTRFNDGTFSEWVCADHWRAVPKRYRLLYTAAKRRWRSDPSEKNARRCERVWARCKSEAIMSGVHFNG